MLHHAILSDSALAIVATDGDLATEHRRTEAAWRARATPDPPSRVRELAAAGRARIWTMTAGGGWVEGPTFALETHLPRLDRFADGRWLVVDRMSGEANTRILSPEGTVLKRFSLGIGVEHLAIDDDRIWGGWDDQSVFPNGAWQAPGRHTFHPAHAVICFTEDGSPSFLPVWPEHGGYVVDPYAMSVDGVGAWSCPYMAALDHFPLVRFVPGEPTRWWRTDVKGSLAIATDGRHAVLAGGYERDRLALLSLPGTGAGEQAVVLATWSLPLPPPSPGGTWASERPTCLIGRGDTIHLVQDRIWYRWRVRDLAGVVTR